MGNVNSVIIEGNLVKSAELRRWNDGTPYCSFSIANNEYFKKSDGYYGNVTSYFDCMIKGNYGESMSRHLLKGRRCTVIGRLKQNSWTDETGLKHSRVFVKVGEISLGAIPGEKKDNAFQNYSQEESQQDYSSAFNDSSDMFDNTVFPNNEEIPF